MHTTAPVSRRAVLGGLGVGALTVGGASRAAAATPQAGAPVLPDPSTVTASDPADLGVLEAASLLQARRLSSRELTQACLDRITARNAPVNAWVRTYPELALRLADAADTRLSSSACGSLGAAPLLAGVPVGLKDLYAVKGLPLTASSKTLDGSSGIFPVNIAAGDSTVWARLKAAGMPLLGHTQMSEFAFSTGTPQTGNPWDTTKSPGGSSGGSAAALAARMTPAATGSDTGGSLRLPSSACGTTTIKATYGLISTYGVLPLEWSYDNAGPMARSVADVALLLSYLAGADDHDAATLAGRPPAFYPTSPTPGPKPLSGKRIGIPNSPSDGSLSAGILAVLTRVKGELAALGASLVPVTSPVDPTTTTAGMALVAEVKTFHSQLYPARAAYYTPFVAEILALYEGENPLAIDYVAAGRFRAQYMAAWNHVFADGTLDAVLQPTQTADTPTRSSTGELTIVTASGTSGPQKMWDSIGFPVVALPAGLSPTTQLPVGIQLVAQPYAEEPLLQIALDYQAAHPYHLLLPPAYR